MNTVQKRTIMKAFISSQFGYCPLVWMLHSRTINTRINKLHERSLRIVYGDRHSSFNELLERDNSVSIHQRNLQMLLIEMYKVKCGLAPQIMSEVFTLRNKVYDLRNNTGFSRDRANTVHYGCNSLSFLGSKIWDKLPSYYKNAESLNVFKNRIKMWKTTDCPCRLCKTYVQNVGFV